MFIYTYSVIYSETAVSLNSALLSLNRTTLSATTMDANPLKPIHTRPWEPPSPLANKRRRLDATSATCPPSHVFPGNGGADSGSTLQRQLPLVTDICRSTIGFTSGRTNSEDTERLPAAVTTTLSNEIVIPSLRTLAESEAELEATTQAYRLSQLVAVQRMKDTAKGYERYIGSYERWWRQDQLDRSKADPDRISIPPFPITAAKASVFLQVESTREKRKPGSQQTIPGSSLGKYHIAGVISALEWWRFNHQHEYRHIPEAQVSLRLDNRIQAFESTSKQNEPQRIEKAQARKAISVSSDLYTEEELKTASWWYLKHFSGPMSLWCALRDRAMLLLSAATAFRGDSARMLLWSDLFKTEVPMVDRGAGVKATALGVQADNVKHNQQGRVDEHGAFRHRLPEICPVGALAMLFFAYFHILDNPPPDFSPNFNDASSGEYGYRTWYGHHVFWAKSVQEEMSYDNHRERVMKMHKANNIEISKVTHATRCYAAQSSRSHGATASGTKALGGWSENGSFRACYDRALPLDALLGSAGFNGRKPETYSLPREILEPPEDLVNEIFPWIENEQAALSQRVLLGKINSDYALRNFLSLLIWLRRILIQDAAILYCQDPHLPLFSFPPFKSDTFKEFAELAVSAMETAELEAKLFAERLPEHFSETVRGLMGEFLLYQNQHSGHMAEIKDEMIRRLHRVEENLGLLALGGSKSSRRHGKLATPPLLSLPEPVSQSRHLAPSTSTEHHLPLPPIKATTSDTHDLPLLVAPDAPAIITLSIGGNGGDVAQTTPHLRVSGVEASGAGAVSFSGTSPSTPSLADTVSQRQSALNVAMLSGSST